MNYQSTRPKTIAKTKSDKADIIFLVNWKNDIQTNPALMVSLKGALNPEASGFA